MFEFIVAKVNTIKTFIYIVDLIFNHYLFTLSHTKTSVPYGFLPTLLLQHYKSVCNLMNFDISQSLCISYGYLEGQNISFLVKNL